MTKKIAFIGAGSYGFTYKLVCDILYKPALKDSEFAFMDVDDTRLKNLKTVMDEYFSLTGYKGKAEYTKDMRAALTNADFVINVVKIGFLEASILDMEIPKKYGLKQTIGDTSSVAGVFRGLRTMIFNKTLLKTIEEVSNPGAIVINYTNPQAMCVMAAEAMSKVPFIGLCHSVQGTTRLMAKVCNVPYESVSFEAAGINHMNWILKFEADGKDLYPIYKQQVGDIEPTRVDLMRKFGYMVTESSTHLPEYVPYYLRNQELIDKWNISIDQFRNNIARKEESYAKIVQSAKEHKLEVPEPSVEYGSSIIDSMVTNVPCTIYANVVNHGLIDNLPEYAGVEVLSVVDRNGVHPCHYGAIPHQLAALNLCEINVHKLAVEAVLQNSREPIYWALMLDPLANSIMTPEQTIAMVDELCEAQIPYHGDYFKK